MRKRTIDMTPGNPAQHILRFAFPLILTNMVLCFPILHILHVFRNVLQAMGIAIWSMCSGVAELFARILMSKVLLPLIGTDALFIAEPASWLGALLCVMLPYFYYKKTLLRD